MKVQWPMAAVFAMLAAPSMVIAQGYPVKGVRIVLPFAAGSAVDVLARFYGQKMSETWKQQVVIDNRTGASGIIGTEIAARAPADGYTLYMGNVATLARAWTYSLQGDPSSGAPNPGRGGAPGGVNSQATPIVVSGVMYLPAANRVVALDPESGKSIWEHVIAGGAPSRRRRSRPYRRS